MEKNNYDIIIVGAGPVGLYLAISLSKKLNILLIEGNKNFLKLKKNKISFRKDIYKTATKLGNYNGLGGTSNIWGGQINSLSKYEVENLKDFNWEEIYKITKKYEHKVYSKIFGFTEKKTKFLLNTYNYLSSKLNKIKYYILPSIWLSPFKNNFYYKFYNEINNNKNISILDNSTVVGFKFDKKKIKGVKIKRKNIIHSIESKKTILCSGTVETTRLLLKFKKTKNIGKELGDHLSIKIGYIENNVKKFNQFFGLKKYFTNLLSFKLVKKHKSQLFFTGFMFDYRSSIYNIIYHLRKFQKKRNLFEIFFLFLSIFINIGKNFKFIYKYIFTRDFYLDEMKRVEVRVGSYQRYNKRNRILLKNEKNDDVSDIDIVWQIEKKEKQNIKDYAVKFIDDWNKSFDFKIKKTRVNFYKTKNYFQGYHPTGTFQIGQNKKFPVDWNYKLKNYENLYIISSGLFSTGGVNNLTFLLFCLVEDFIKKFKIK